MKKRLLCIIMVCFMVLPLILTSCGDELTPQEIATKNFQDADVALTLSLWIPTDSDPDSEDFKLRVKAVEDAINDILRSENKSTAIDIVAVKDSEYEQKLSQRFDEIREAEKTNETAYQTAEKYKNEAIKNELTGLYEMAYPPVLDTQLDIFLVRGYNNYITYINNQDAYKLNEFFVEGKVYNGLFKLIRNQFIDASKVDGGYYAIPNNHEYSEKAQYILVNKELFDAYSDIEWADVTDLYSLKSFIESVGAQNVESVVPFVGSIDNVPGVIYLDKDNLIAGGLSNSYVDEATGKTVYTPDFVYNLDEYKNYMEFYKSLDEQGFVKDSLVEGKKAAVQVLNGNICDLEKYSDCYSIQVLDLYADLDDVFASMFAVSSHSANHDRAMQVLYMLQDNSVIRTLLQYGIEDVDYTLSTNEDNETIINVNENSAYKMNILYTGNGYRTYLGDGFSIADWDAIKDANLLVQLHPYLSSLTYIAQGKLTQEQKEQYSALISQLTAKNALVKEAFESMTLEDFKSIYSALDETIEEMKTKLAEYQANFDDYNGRVEQAKKDLENATTDAEKNTAQSTIDRYQPRVDTYAARVTEYKAKLEIAQKYEAVNSAVADASQEDLLKLYKKIYESAK